VAAASATDVGEFVSALRLPALAEPLNELRRRRTEIIRDIERVVQELRALPAKEQKLAGICEMIQRLSALATDSSFTDFAFLTALREALLTDKGETRVQGFYYKGNPKSPALHDLKQQWQPLLERWAFDDSGDSGFDLAGQLALLFQEARRHYLDLCFAERRFDFHDLAGMLVTVLGQPEFARRLTGNIRYILVDEFQDTNELHWRVVAGLAGDDAEAAVRSGKLMIVGDPQQSIYRFRKADPTVFERVEALIAAGNR